jgi:hypothetical protein
MPAKDIFYLVLYHIIMILCLLAFWREPWLLIPASLMSVCVTLDTALKMVLEEDRQENGKE